ncbi:MAG: cobalt transporter CbiM [Desulfobulbus sp.]|nr:cobalt transporter CbiM [Desulfobulbus sp.]
MHIADGVLPTAVAAGSYVLTLAGLGFSLRVVNNRELPKIAVVTSSFFVASLIHLPLGPTSVHLLLPGIVGALLGPAAFLSITVGLFLQSLLFQFGGLTALGANGLMMGLPALLCGLVFRRFRGNSQVSNAIVGGLVSAVGVVLAALLLALLLATGGESFLGVARMAVLAHVPVMVVEGLVGGFVISFLFRVKPELLGPIPTGAPQ